MRTISPSTRQECKDFAEAFGVGSLDRLKSLLFIIPEAPKFLNKPRHGQRIGQYLWNNVICSGELCSGYSLPLPCLFYAPDGKIAMEVMSILYEELQARLAILELSNNQQSGE